MENEPSLTNPDLTKLSISYVKGAFADYFGADLRGFTSDEEQALLKRGIELSIDMAKKAKIDPYDVVIAGVEGCPTPSRLAVLNALGPSMGLEESDLEEIRVLFGIF